MIGERTHRALAFSAFRPVAPARWHAALLRAAALVLVGVPDTGWSGEFYGVYTGDLWFNVGRGGLATGRRYLSNLIVGAELPLTTTSGDRQGGASLTVSALHNNGRFFSGDLVGDTQIVSNIEARSATRIYEANYEYRSRDGRSSWLAGLWDLNSEIDVIAPAGLFLNSSHGIGAEFATSGRNGPSIFPVTALALRFRQTLSDRLTLRAAVVDGVPGDPNNPDRPRARFQLGSGDGALLTGEVAYALGPRWLAKAGAWRYTVLRPHLDNPAIAGEEPEERGETGAAQGIYASVTGVLWGRDSSVDTFLRAGVANGDVQQVASYLGAGIVWSEFAPALRREHLGLAIAHARAGSTSRRLGDDRHETSLELTFSARPAPWLRVQPNLQYVLNPGFDPKLDNALVLGLRIDLIGRYGF